MAVLKQPARTLATYFTLWSNGGNIGRITNLSSKYNQIHLFHGTPVGGQNQGNGVFEFQYGSAVTAAECKTMQDRGVRVILTLGGANAGFNFTTRAQSTNFVNSVRNIITSLGNNVSGVDYNFFEAFVGSSATEVLWISQQLAATYGSDFSFHCPPHPNMNTHPVDKAIIQALAGSGLPFAVGPQFYDSSSLYDPTYQRQAIRDMVALVGGASAAKKVIIGVGSNYGGGQSTASSRQVWIDMVAEFPLLGGMFGWSAQDDAGGGYGFANTLQPVIGAYPVDAAAPPPPPPPAPPPAPPPGTPPTPDPGGGTVTIGGGSGTASTPLPPYAKILGVYYFGYSGGDIRDCDGHANHVNLFHLVPRNGSIGPGAHTWPEGLDGPTTFAKDRIQYLRNKGIRVGITIGGQGEAFHFTTDTHVANFVTSFRNIVTAHGPIDHIDWNNFEQLSQDFPGNTAFATNMGNKMADIYIALRDGSNGVAGYGSNFTCGMAPAPGGGYAPLDRVVASTMNSRGALTWSNPQYYDDEGYTVTGVIPSLTAEWITLLGAQNKVAFLTTTRNYGALEGGDGPSAAVVTADTNAVKAASPNFRGVFYWTGNNDRAQGWLDTTMQKGLISPTAVTPPSGGVGSTVTLAAPQLLVKNVFSLGETVSAAVTVTTTGAPVATTQMIVTFRPPSGTHASGPYLDQLVDPGSVFPTGNRTYNASYTFPLNAELGYWKTYGTWQDTNGVYHDGPETVFLLQAQPVVEPPAPAAPVADFTVNRTTAVAGTPQALITLTSTSTGTISTYKWFPDYVANPGIFFSGASLQYSFSQVRSYTVRLEITGPGGSSSKTYTDLITITAPIIPPPPPPPPPPPAPIPPAYVEPPRFVEPYVILQWSNDGKNWSKEIWVPAGKIGEYQRRMRVYQLGAARTRFFRVRYDAPIKMGVAGATLEIAEGRH